ncbi:MAG TPA: ABC transporter permease, partial [Longimicrobiales bacterium]|nr:ABC transporter permease [Longimicrobiales bacterium]
EEEARSEAIRRFGDVERIKEGMRKMTKRKEARMRSLQWRDVFTGDVRFAFRQLVRNPVFTLVALVTLALGIGANTAIFSVVDGILFRPLPYPDSDELVVVWTDVTRRGGPDDEWFSWANFHDVREEAASLESLAAWGGLNPVLTGRGEALQLLGAQISRGMFDRVLQVEPALGRAFQPEDHEPDAPAVALLSDGLWRDAFAADPEVLGTSLVLNDQPVTVVGVMPADFRPPFVPGAELWLPTQVDPSAVQDLRGNFSWRTVGRLAPDAGIDRLATELDEMGRRLEADYPGSNTDMGFRAVPLHDDLVAEARTGLLVLLGAVGFVLLVACVNVASLLMARATARSSELAVRSALGAGRRRIVQQLLVESALLAAIGGAAGIGVALFGTDLLVSLAPAGTPRLDEVGVDGRILAFTVAITLLAGIVFGLLPALRAARADLHTNLREGGRGQGRTLGSIRLRASLVVGQVALALVLLVGAGLLVRSFRNLTTQDLGFRPADVLTMQVNLPFSRYSDAETRIEAYDRLEAALGAIPGVTSVGLTSTVPLTGFNGDVTFNVEGRPLPAPGQADATWFRRVTPTYFGTMGISI